MSAARSTFILFICLHREDDCKHWPCTIVERALALAREEMGKGGGGEGEGGACQPSPLDDRNSRQECLVEQQYQQPDSVCGLFEAPSEQAHVLDRSSPRDDTWSKASHGAAS